MKNVLLKHVKLRHSICFVFVFFIFFPVLSVKDLANFVVKHLEKQTTKIGHFFNSFKNGSINQSLFKEQEIRPLKASVERLKIQKNGFS